MKRVFLDHNATTFPSKDVVKAIKKFEDWGNPSSIHSSGRRARSKILHAKREIAKMLGVSPGELSFTSGGSESNNIVIRGLVNRLLSKGLKHIVTTESEHPSVCKTIKHIKEFYLDIQVHYCPVDYKRGLDYSFLEETLKNNPVGLVSLMTANNETGEIYDIKKVRALIDTHTPKRGKTYLHSDMVQTLGKMPFDIKEMGVDFASFSAHKFYALQGAGLLYHKKGCGFEPLITGGGQERGRRAGTENLMAIHAMGLQFNELKNLNSKLKTIKELRDYLETRIKDSIEGLQILASDRQRLSNTSLILIEDAHGETLLMNLDLLGFDVSTGAACSSGSPEPSPVLRALGLSLKEASESLRVSLGWSTTKEEIDSFVEHLVNVVEKIRSI
jgi:cysteine desulfurase